LRPFPVTFLSCDHTSLASIKECANAIKAQTDRLDILMCNAGVMALPAGTTKDGYEIQFGINHLSHALLVKQLLPTLLATADMPNSDVRIINMTSIAYQQAPPQGIDFKTLISSQEKLGKIIPGPKWS
jgi:NAD(P)-dependent dehydrogenase (short-subunit alcohol dehydrogenase family)